MIAVVQNGVVLKVGEWDWQISEPDGIPLNPLPENATEGDFDLVLGANGEYYLPSDYRSLRKVAYPCIGDQLDALYKAGAFPAEMAEKISAVKKKYAKP